MGTAFFDATDKPETQPPDSDAVSPRSVAAKGRLRRAAMLQALAGSIWIPQAGLLAISVGRIADGGGLHDVLWPAFGTLALGLARSCLDAAGSRLAFQAARAELSRKRQAAVAALSLSSPIDRGRPASGKAASVVGEQAELIVPYLARFQPARMKASLVPLVILAFILPVSWIAALVLLFAAPLIPIFMALIGWRAQAASEKQLVATGGLNGFLLDRLRGLATIRALDAVDATALRLRREAESLRLRTMAVLKIAFLSSAVLELFAALGVAMIAVYVGFSLLGEIRFGTWAGRLDLTEGLFILLLAPAFFEPLRELSAVWHDRAAGEAALKALEALAAGGLPIRGSTEAAAPTSVGAPAVRFENLAFRYGAGEPLIVDGFNLDITAGEHLALLGASGSGKSTLLSLIAGLAPCSGGRIIIGGVELADAAAGNLRGAMAWIGQKPHIFVGTIAGNISLGRSGIARVDITDALGVARLGKVTEAYGDRPLGEGGIGLSGGEALRLAIARAACNPHLRLILADEPTAHLDAATAAEVTESLLSLARGRTLVVATHDPLLAARMHRSVRIDSDSFLREAAE
ncbi:MULTISPECIES: thiol reductant ABC exporter subunit CydD [Rhizobium]|uniref:Cysteine ABC transporter ATP-binding/permease protein CydD n=1 Tax=Rhizobium phaseoli TaxID=396 RepID=A0A2U3CS11_9HYPH|nr:MULTISPECIES: thiol reductant ABC exporter subunit CydD [Rhizobium]KEC70440.1 cytochrome bc biosynthesis ABC transporter ATP-binding protein [Rhizobium leguminosarum bv. phaseoli CCGM1]ANL50330.1 cysteine ABC transporter ATP-binding/permease protein CydD [Rhizobium phaseoli]ANL88439.1 cysteine ABC transporter ATP-binding/permease protein CydD [Rhizobium phaseoli]ANL94948.1 cysteine ABC transporter ATP-binding/permease protein CydD [Rhizobium phaseoli]MDE8757901.1 thiol reductant ABC exporte